MPVTMPFYNKFIVLIVLRYILTVLNILLSSVELFEDYSQSNSAILYIHNYVVFSLFSKYLHILQLQLIKFLTLFLITILHTVLLYMQIKPGTIA